jgi:hypothetical protein
MHQQRVPRIGRRGVLVSLQQRLFQEHHSCELISAVALLDDGPAHGLAHGLLGPHSCCIPVPLDVWVHPQQLQELLEALRWPPASTHSGHDQVAHVLPNGAGQLACH